MNSWKANRPPAWDLQTVSSVLSKAVIHLPSIEDVHEWNGKNIRLLGSGKVGDVSVEGDLLLQSDVSKAILVEIYGPSQRRRPLQQQD